MTPWDRCEFAFSFSSIMIQVSLDHRLQDGDNQPIQMFVVSYLRLTMEIPLTLKSPQIHEGARGSAIFSFHRVPL